MKKIYLFLLFQIIFYGVCSAATWYPVYIKDLPGTTLIKGQPYKNYQLVLLNNTTQKQNITASIKTMPEGFPVNLPNACQNVTLNPNKDCIIANVDTNTFLKPEDSAGYSWNISINDGFEIFDKTIKRTNSNGLVATITNLPNSLPVTKVANFQVNVKNTSSMPLSGLSFNLPILPGLTYPSGQNTCKNIGILQPGNNCYVTGVYTPPVGSHGVVNIPVVVANNKTNTVKLSVGTLVTAIPVVGTVNPASGNVAVGSTEAFTYTFTNNAATGNATNVAMTLPSGPGIAISNDTCSSLASSTLNAGASCSVEINYTPTVADQGTHDWTATLAYNEGGTVVLQHESTVTAIPVVGTVNPASGNVAVGSTEAFTYTFTNNAATGNATNVAMTLPSGPGIAISNDTCSSLASSTLNAGASCSVEINYTPTVADQGTHDWTATLAYNEGGTVVLQHESTVTAIPVVGTVNPASGNVAVGSTEAFTYTFTNNAATGNATNVAMTLPSGPGIAISNDTCSSLASSTLNAGASCSVEINYTPTVADQGTHDWTATLAYNEGGTVVLQHESTVTAIPVVGTVNPASGNVAVGSTEAFTYTFTNNAATGNATNVAMTLPSGPGIAISNDTCSSLASSTLNAGASCSVEINYTPTVADQGTHDWTATLAYNEGGTVVLQHESTVTAIPVVGTVNSASGNVAVGSTEAFTYTFTNNAATGNATNVAMTLPSGPGIAISNDTCSSLASSTLNAGASCSVEINYTPTVADQGTHDWTATLAYNEGGTVVLQHESTVTAIPVVGTVNSASGNVAVGSTEAFTYTFTNNAATGNATNVAMTLPSGPGIAISNDTCSSLASSTLNAGASCSVEINYTPTVADQGTHYWTATLAYNEGGTVVLQHESTVTAIPVVGTVNPASGNVAVGSTEAFTYTFTNNAATGNATNVAMTLPSGPGIAISNDTCSSLASSTLNAGASCSVEINYTPTVADQGTHDWTATLAYNEGGTVVLQHESTVTAIPVVGKVNPASGNVAVGSTEAFTYTFTNNAATGNATNVAMTLPSGPGIAISNDTCSSLASSTLNAGASCSVEINYTPTVADQGTHYWTATLAYNEGGTVVLQHESFLYLIMRLRSRP